MERNHHEAPFSALGTAWCGRSPVTRDIQMGSLPIRVAIFGSVA